MIAGWYIIIIIIILYSTIQYNQFSIDTPSSTSSLSLSLQKYIQLLFFLILLPTYLVVNSLLSQQIISSLLTSIFPSQKSSTTTTTTIIFSFIIEKTPFQKQTIIFEGSLNKETGTGISFFSIQQSTAYIRSFLTIYLLRAFLVFDCSRFDFYQHYHLSKIPHSTNLHLATARRLIILLHHRAGHTWEDLGES